MSVELDETPKPAGQVSVDTAAGHHPRAALALEGVAKEYPGGVVAPLAGTLSHKHRPPALVEPLHLDAAARYELAELVDGITPARSRPAPAATGPERAARTELDELLLAIPAATYVRELTGLKPRRNGKVNCPFHDLSVGRAVTAGVLPACSLVDASLTDRGGPR